MTVTIFQNVVFFSTDNIEKELTIKNNTAIIATVSLEIPEHQKFTEGKSKIPKAKMRSLLIL